MCLSRKFFSTHPNAHSYCLLFTGYLPTFGPCFINFYGSPREFNELTNDLEILNKGVGEGVAYRGRVLAELHTTLGETPDVSQCDIPSEDLLKIQKYLRRRKFRLHTVFMNANMIMSVDAPVEFEVSIGNYGNMLDPNVQPSCSTTQPTNAVFDGKVMCLMNVKFSQLYPSCVSVLLLPALGQKQALLRR
jgi:hypothetical protein